MSRAHAVFEPRYLPIVVAGVVLAASLLTATLSLREVRSARTVALDERLDAWAMQTISRRWDGQLDKISMDLPPEFGADTSTEVLLLVVGADGSVIARSRDWPSDLSSSILTSRAASDSLLADGPRSPPPTVALLAPSPATAASAPATIPYPPPPVPGKRVIVWPGVSAWNFIVNENHRTTRWTVARGGTISLFAGVTQQVIDRSIWILALQGLVLASLASGAAFAIATGMVSASRRDEVALLQWVRDTANGITAPTDLPSGAASDELRTQLAKLRARLAASHEQAFRFTGDAAHELRSPLTAMQVKIDRLIQRPEESTVLQQDLADIAGDIHRLGGLIRRLSWLALADAGRLQLHRTTLDLSIAVRTLVEETIESETGVLIHPDIAPNLNVEGDETLLTHAISNLLSNAVQHNRKKGWVRVVACREERLVTVSVRNSVAHPLPIVRERVFERFFRGSYARLDKTGGSGIGLSLAREIARAHGGDVLVEDSPRDEAWFVLRIPVGTQ